MLERKDYIMRQVNQLGLLIARLLKLAKDEDKDDAQIQTVFDECLTVLGTDRDTIRSADPRTVIDGLSDVRLLSLLNELLSIRLPGKPDDALSELRSAVMSRLSEMGYYQFDTECPIPTK